MTLKYVDSFRNQTRLPRISLYVVFYNGSLSCHIGACISFTLCTDFVQDPGYDLVQDPGSRIQDPEESW